MIDCNDLLSGLIEFVSALWKADSDLRDSSLVGESQMDRRSRRWVSVVCGTLISLLVVAGIAWVWVTGWG